MTRTNGMRRNQDGAAAVEMALVLPILLLLVFGIIEFGFIFNRYITVTHAAREGVRQMSVGMASDDAEAEALATAPTVGFPIACEGSEMVSGESVEMTCDTTYNLNLFVINADVPLTSTARMRKE